MSHGISEPARLHGLTKQVTEAKEGPLELRRKKARLYTLGGRRWGKAQTCSRKRKRVYWVFYLKGFKCGDFRGNVRRES